MTIRQPLMEAEYRRLLVKGLRSKFAPIAAERHTVRRQNFEPKQSLAEFTALAWKVLEPATKMVWGWYADAICEHLEAVTQGQIKNLIINIPPRFSKSTIAAVSWPCWVWTFKPELKFLFASYGADLSERDSLKCRRLLRSPWYQAEFGSGADGGERFHIVRDKDTVQKFENNYGGYRIATSVGGVTTGEGADILVCDDPLKAKDGDSKSARDSANSWWAETMASRLNDLRTGAKVIIMQRLHEEDLTGYVLSTEAGYELLCMPMEYEQPRTAQGVTLPKPVTSLGWADPRNRDGELLCPERAGPQEVIQLRAETTEYAWAGQYQQRPAPRGGGTFKRAWFEIVPPSAVPKRAIRLRSWDRAATAGGGAFSAGVRWSWVRRFLDDGTIDSTFYIEDVVRGQWATDEREAITRQTAMADGRSTVVVLEREPGSAGIDSVRATIKSLPGYVVRQTRATGSKEVRAEPMQVQAAAGAVKLVQGPWNQSFLQEISTFPHGRYRDQVDAATLGFNELTRLLPKGRAVAGPAPGQFKAR